MKLSASTRIHDLLEEHAFLEDFLAGYDAKFEMLRSRMARATLGRLATLKVAAGIASIDLNDLLEAVAAEIERRTGSRPDLERSAEGERQTRERRIRVLEEIIHDLHDGGDLERARSRFAEAIEDVEASEIAAMEEELIRGGMPVSEVQRLCDVHVSAFRQALDEHQAVEVPPGHPVHTYVAENRILTRLANALGSLAREAGRGRDAPERFASIEEVLRDLDGIESHYQRKENQLFPLLERHGVTGPPQVMWGVHDQIRAALASVREAVAQRDAESFSSQAPALARDIVEMVYKEEKVLFPMSLETLSEEEWAEVRRGEDALGYGLAQPAASWPSARPEAMEAVPAMSPEGLLALRTGALSLDQVNLVLTHLPVDLSFVDETDTVRFYSEGPDRIFPRSPAVIGRKVQACHPPKSVHVVQSILDAVRDEAGAYRGCLEVSQDVTPIRALTGEQRLLDRRME